jgi:hypothetical protein
VTDAPLVQDVLRRESRSILQYVGDAYPWTDAAHEQELSQLQVLIREEQEALAGLARLLQRHHLAPLPSGMYPVSFTTLNFVSLDHILKLLNAYEERSSADLRAAVAEAKHHETRQLLESFLELKQRHLATLRQLLASAGEKMVTG